MVGPLSALDPAPSGDAAPPPAAPGEELAGWTVLSVHAERRRLRVRVQRGPETAAFSVHPREGYPRPGPFDTGGFRVYTEATSLPFAALVGPGRELSRRLQPVPASGALRALRSWARQGRGAQGGETFELDDDPREALEELAAFVAEGGTGARVRGPLAAFASPGATALLAQLPRGVRLEPAVEGEADEPAVLRMLGQLARAGLRVQLVFVPTARSASQLATLAPRVLLPLPTEDGAACPTPVDAVSVQLPAVRDYDARQWSPPRLAGLFAALARAHAAGARRVRVSSRLGEPACHSPSALRLALLPKAGQAPSSPDATYDPRCAGCAVRGRCGGVSAAYAGRFGTGELVPFVATGAAPAWAQKARWLLAGRTGDSVTLGELMQAKEVPAWPCHLPWTRLELGDGGPVGPCCMEYQERPAPELVPLGAIRPADFGIRDQVETPEELWNGERLKGFRRAMSHGGHPETCRTSCPVLVGGTYLPRDMILWGGPPASVEGQLRLVEDMVAGAEVVRSPPQSLCVSTTSYCNYHCVMCDFGERGTLADEKPDRFWTGLEHWLDALQQIDANGGEPLASPAFRAFLERADFPAHPQLGISLTTNLSYLSPSQLERFGRVPLSSLTISVNAATPATYLAVMRGLPMERWRENVEAVLRRRAHNPASLGLTYSFVILKQNVGEVRAFYELTRQDGVNARYMLPMRNLNDQSIMTSLAHMEEARRALEEVAADLGRRGRDFERSLVRANLTLLGQRLRDGILTPL